MESRVAQTSCQCFRLPRRHIAHKIGASQRHEPRPGRRILSFAPQVARTLDDDSLEPFLPVVGVLGLLALWSGAAHGGFVDPVLLPSPRAAFDALWSGLGGKLGWDLMRTVERTVWAILIAAVIGIPLGIVLGSSVRLYRALEFVIDFFRSTPASAMFPLFLVLFGVGDETKISVAAFGAILVILFNVAYLCRRRAAASPGTRSPLP